MRYYSQPSQIVNVDGSIGAADWPLADAREFAADCAACIAASIAASFSSSVMSSEIICDAFITCPPVDANVHFSGVYM